VGDVDTNRTEPPRRQVAFVQGRWWVTYLCDAPDRHTEVRSGLLVGPLVPDLSSSTIWVAVVPDGNKPHIMIRRDSITSIATPLGEDRYEVAPPWRPPRQVSVLPGSDPSPVR
jgi:hypothetical protein